MNHLIKCNFHNPTYEYESNPHHNYRQQYITQAEERLDRLKARLQQNPSSGLQIGIQMEEEGIGILEEKLIRYAG